MGHFHTASREVIFPTMKVAALSLLLAASAPAQQPVRVLVWDEQQPEQKQAYGETFLGETIAAHLASRPGLTVKSVALSSPEQGLSPALLDQTDVLIFWSNQKNDALDDARADDIVRRVKDGKLGFIALHSAIGSKPFVKLMQEKTIADARKKLGADAKWKTANPLSIGKAVTMEDAMTPGLELEDDAWTLTLPSCSFAINADEGEASSVITINTTHPIAKGLPTTWEIPKTERQAGHLHLPTPDVSIFLERWKKKGDSRSGSVWNIGAGAVFYFRPGHETYPIYRQKEPLQVIENAIRWLHPAP
jgi:trehalose utilization protein